MGYDAYQHLRTGEVTEIPVGEQTLLLVRPGGQWPIELAMHRLRPQALPALLRAFRSHPHTIGQLRGYWPRYRPGDGRLSDAQLLQGFAAAVEAGRIDALILPRAGGAPTSAIAVTPPANRAALQAGADRLLPADGKPVARWTIEERFAYVLVKAAKDVPGAIGDFLLGLVTPQGLAMLVVFAGLEATADSTGVGGLLANGALILLLWGLCGVSAFYGVKDFAAFVLLTFTANDQAGLDRAAQDLVQAAELLGVAALGALAGWMKVKSLKPGVGTAGDAADSGGSATQGDALPSGRGGTLGSKVDAGETSPLKPKKIGETEPGAVDMTPEIQAQMDAAQDLKGMSAEGYPDLPEEYARTFMEPPRPWNGDECTAPIKRVVGIGNNSNGMFWTSDLPATEAEWRGGAAVQNNWNGNGGYVQSNPAGLRGWIGKAAPQLSSDGTHVLPGGGEQIWIPQGTATPASPMPTPWSQ